MTPYFLSPLTPFTASLTPRTVDLSSGPVERTDTFGDIGGQERTQRGWLTDEQLIQFKLCPGALSLYKKKHAGDRLWVKVSPLVKEWHHQDSSTTPGPDLSEDSVDIQDVRNRSGVWPIVEAAVRELLFITQRPSDLNISYLKLKTNT